MNGKYAMQPGQPTYPTRQSGPPLGAAPVYRGRASSSASGIGLTLGGVLLFAIGLLVIGSGLSSVRLSIFGLLLHPYLFVVAPIFPFLVFARIHEFPMSTLVGIVVFTLIYTWSSADHDSIAWVVKLYSGMVTIVTVALLVRSRADFVAGTVGLMLAIGILGSRGLAEETTDATSLGVRAIDSANKNSYSLYALPPMLLAGHIVLRYKSVPWLLKGVLIAAALAALTAIFMSGNRSGYAGAVAIALLLLWDSLWEFKVRSVSLGMMLVGTLVVGVIFVLTHYGSTEIFNRRWEQTTQGTESDTLRVNIFKACMKIGLENPVIGVSQAKLSTAIGAHLNMANEVVGPHNVVGAIIGGSGLICFAALIWIGASLWFWKPSGKEFRKGLPAPVIEAKKLLRYMLILWLFRGMFNDEILSNPGFCIGLGLAIGLCAVAGRQTVLEQRKASLPSPGQRMAAITA